LLELLEEAVERFVLRLHGYVLMDNHYHLLLQLSDANLSRAMQWLGVSYTVWFNRRHGRVRHLFQGRFKGILVQEARGRELSRYVHLNAVRLKGLGLDKTAQRAEWIGAGARPDAGQIKERLERLRQYRWSSYRAYVGKDRCPAWLTTGVVLAMGAPGRDWAQRQAYRRYVEEPVRAGWMESPWERVEVQVGAGWR
jgi:REP element-mobilizing transposase RayT